MPPLLPLIGIAALAVAAVRFGRREIARVTRLLDDREQSTGAVAQQEAPVLRRDPASGQWRVDGATLDDAH